MATMTRERAMTETSEPPRPEGRLKTSFRNSDECTHRWSANTQPHGKAGNVYFDGGVIYSYGRHFPMARHVQRRGRAALRPFVLVTTDTYSNSTAKHLSGVRSAVRGQTVYHVSNVLADTKAAHLANLDEIAKQAAKSLETAKRARLHRGFHEERAASLLTEGNAYAEAVGLKRRLPAPNGEELAAWVEGITARNAAEKRAAAAAASKKAAADLAEWLPKLEAWKLGSGERPGTCPDASHPFAELAFLRVRGSRVETSMGAVVPLSAVVPVLAEIRAGNVYNGGSELCEPWEIDGFQLREIDQEAKRVVIGCHVITFDEAERVAATAGL